MVLLSVALISEKMGIMVVGSLSSQLEGSRLGRNFSIVSMEVKKTFKVLLNTPVISQKITSSMQGKMQWRFKISQARLTKETVSAFDITEFVVGRLASKLSAILKRKLKSSAHLLNYLKC